MNTRSLPVTEDFVVRRRRREQEQEERTRRNRGANTVQVLTDAGILEPGTTIHVGLDALVGAWRPAVEEFLASHSEAALAEWSGETTARSVGTWSRTGGLFLRQGCVRLRPKPCLATAQVPIDANTATAIPDGMVVLFPPLLVDTKSGPHTALTATTTHIAMMATDAHISVTSSRADRSPRSAPAPTGPCERADISHLLPGPTFSPPLHRAIRGSA
jgi:hypothetical protein